MGLRVPALSPVAWTTIDRVTQQVLWLILFAILAPILGPRPYGLFSIVMVFVGFCEFVLLEGAIEALVTMADLDPLHTTTANLVNAAIGLGLGAIIVVAAPAVSLVFQDPDIARLMWALMPLPLMAALSATPVAVLRRSQRYKQLAVRSIAGLAIGGIIGIAAGIMGAGVWALALQVLTQRAAEFVIGWIAVPVRLAFTWSARHFHEMRPVAMNVFVARIMTFAGGQFPRIILGYTLGPTELGLYTLANRFLEVIVNTAIMPRALVGRIELRDSKPGSPEFEQTFSTMAQNISLLTFPILVGAAAMTPDLFRIWLDQRWQAGVIPTQLLLLSGLPLVFLYCIDAALLAANLSSMFKWSATIQTVSIIAVMICASPFGLDVTCLMLAIRAWMLLPFFFWWVRRACHLSVANFGRQPVRALAGAIAMGVLLNLPLLRLPYVGQKFEFVFLILVGVAFYGAFLFGFARSQLKSLMGGLMFHRSGADVRN